MAPQRPNPPPPSRADTQNLEWHGRQWRAVVAVPRDLRESMGKSHLKRSLYTHDLRTANRLKPVAVASLRAEIAKARRVATNASADTVARFLADSGYQLKSASDARRSIRRLAEYLRVAAGVGVALEEVDRPTAKGFLRHLLNDQGLAV